MTLGEVLTTKHQLCRKAILQDCSGASLLSTKQYYLTQHIIYTNKKTGKTTQLSLLSQHNQMAKEFLLASL